LSEEEREKTVTIRGVDKELYNRALALAKELGKSAGEMVNEALKLLLSTATTAATAISKAAELVEGVKEAAIPVHVVSGVEELTVRRADLESLEKPVVFKGIKRLVFEDDVDYEVFDSKVRHLIMCGEVQVPKSYPKLKVAEKCKLVGKLSEKP